MLDSSKEWQINYSYIDYDKFMFVTGKFDWMITAKDISNSGAKVP
jgi:hypothetical protein